MGLAGRLDLPLAWRRLKQDIRSRQTFVSHPFEVALMESDAAALYSWFDSIKREIEDGSFGPYPCRIVDCPKQGWHARPAAVLRLADALVYSALVIDSVDRIKNELAWSSESVRFSTILNPDQTTANWTKFDLEMWMKFNERSIDRLADDYSHVIIADISAFYENIDIRTLVQDLELIGVPLDSRALLSSCLKKWADARNRGIPQGYSPSNILAEVYLDSVDKRLNREKVAHFRYSDDLRILCTSKREAIYLLHMLASILRERGLNLQTAKTQIVNVKDAETEIARTPDLIADARTEVIKDLRRELDSAYISAGTPLEIRRLRASQKIDQLKLVSLRLLFDELTSETDQGLNSTMLHFILNRLAAAKDDYAIDFCLSNLSELPHETRFILDYLSEMPEQSQAAISDGLARLLESNSFYFEYQRYQVTKWLFDTRLFTEGILRSVRSLIRMREIGEDTKNYCLTYLGEFGDPSDMDYIWSLYPSAGDPLLKTAMICSLRRMQKSKRNRILDGISEEQRLVRLAVKWTRSQE